MQLMCKLVVFSVFVLSCIAFLRIVWLSLVKPYGMC